MEKTKTFEILKMLFLKHDSVEDRIKVINTRDTYEHKSYELVQKYEKREIKLLEEMKDLTEHLIEYNIMVKEK